jgi:hypothetical protein
MKKEYVNEALMLCHKAAESFFFFFIINADEMREFDEGWLVRKHETSPEVDKFIEMENDTQHYFTQSGK